MKLYQTELMESVRLADGKVTYYVKICDVFKRVSKSEYDRRYNEADGLSCLYSKESRTHRRSYRTVTYEVAE